MLTLLPTENSGSPKGSRSLGYMCLYPRPTCSTSPTAIHEETPRPFEPQKACPRKDMHPPSNVNARVTLLGLPKAKAWDWWAKHLSNEAPKESKGVVKFHCFKYLKPGTDPIWGYSTYYHILRRVSWGSVACILINPESEVIKLRPWSRHQRQVRGICHTNWRHVHRIEAPNQK